jgi:hypothetical protein
MSSRQLDSTSKIPVRIAGSIPLAFAAACIGSPNPLGTIAGWKLPMLLRARTERLYVGNLLRSARISEVMAVLIISIDAGVIKGRIPAASR